MKSRHKDNLIGFLDCCKNSRHVCCKTFNLENIQDTLRYRVKEYFPINGVPENIIHSLECLDVRIKIALDQLEITLDKIIHEIEKLDGLEKK